MNKEEAIKIAREFAVVHGNGYGAPSYLPRNSVQAGDFEPHAWVVTSILAAVAAERQSLAAKLRAEMDLDGFGCACEPQRRCNTCNARSVLSKVLTPLAKELDA